MTLIPSVLVVDDEIQQFTGVALIVAMIHTGGVQAVLITLEHAIHFAD